MTLLFDVSPEEPTRKRGSAKRTSAPEHTPAKEPEKAPSIVGNPPARVFLPIGTIDDAYECAGGCGAWSHDILHEDGREWYVSCAICGTCQWVVGIKGHLKPRLVDFVMRDGRFAGMTFAEIERQPRGLDYLKWAAAEHPRPSVREVAKKHLDSKTGAP